MSDPVLFLIPARGGSQRIPHKNLRSVAGIPLVGHAARIARRAAVGLADGPHRIVCSTNDPAIAEAARAWGAEVPFMRSAELASETASSVDVALDALDRLERDGTHFRALVLVQPTSPLTSPDDLRAAVALFDRIGGPSVVSVVPTHPVAWHGDLGPDDGDRFRPVGVDGASDILSGAFYVIAPAALRGTRRFVDPGVTVGQRVSPELSPDVDEEADLIVAEALMAARPIRPVGIAGRVIGDGRVFVLAEAGVNHDGQPELAHRLIDAAADAGADAVKFQTFDPAALAAPGAPLAEYQRRAADGAVDQRQMLARLALADDVWPGLQAHAVDRGLVFLSSPFDDASADLLDRLDVPAFKVASGELTNLPFLTRLARRGRPLLVSTGMADMVEVAAAVDAIGAAGDPPVALFHCVSAYPADPSDANLAAMETLRRAFHVPTGWSDHSLGVELPIAAAALGADLIEKHLTLDRARPGPDHRASMEPAEFAAMVGAVRAVRGSIGSGAKTPAEAERSVAAVARRSLYWARSLARGSRVGPDDLVALRPAAGLSPARTDELLGQRTARSVSVGALVQVEDLGS